MKILKTVYYFVAILVLIIVGIDVLQNMEISLYDVLFSIFGIIVIVVFLSPIIMTVWEEYQECKNKNK